MGIRQPGSKSAPTTVEKFLGTDIDAVRDVAEKLNSILGAVSRTEAAETATGLLKADTAVLKQGAVTAEIGAVNAKNTAVDSANNAVASASAAATSRTNAKNSEDAAALSAEQADLDAVATAADRVQTGLDVIATAADRVQTGLDVIATGADKTATNNDALATAADRIQTGQDVIATGADTSATAADRVATGLDAAATAADKISTNADKLATAADRVQTGLDAVATAADVVTTGTAVINAAASEMKASQWADANQNIEVETGRYSAKHWAMEAQATVTGVLVYRASWDASGGVYPASPVKGDYYKISVAGTINGVPYEVNDSLIYNGIDWDKIDSTESVSSVNGQTGTVVVTKTDVGLGSAEDKTFATGTADATHAATSKDTPVDADEIPLSDSAATWSLKKLTWVNIKTALKSYFDTLYSAVSHTHALDTVKVSRLAASDGSPDPVLSSDTYGNLTATKTLTCNNSVAVVPNIGDGRFIATSTGSTYYSFFGLEDNNNPRWRVSKENDAETGSNAGSSFSIGRYSDGGAYLGTALSINRADGEVGITNTLRLSGNVVGPANNSASTAIYGGGAYNTGAGVVAYGASHATLPNVLDFTNGASVSRMRIATNGNVGIGITSPAEKLHVGGSVRANEFKTATTSIVPLILPTLGAIETYSKVLSIPGYIGSNYWNFSAILTLVAAGSNSPGTYRASGNLYVVWKQTGTDFNLLVEGDFTGNVYYSWNTTTKTYDLWIDHGGYHNILHGQAIVTPMAVANYQLGQLATQSDATGLTAITIGTLITNT